MIQKRHREEQRLKARKRETARILGLPLLGRPATYDRYYHPDDVVAYFQKALDEVQEIESTWSASGGRKYVQRPVPPPTLAGYAAKAGVSTECIWSWTVKHEEFDEAVKRAKAIQQEVFLRMATLGAYDRSITIFCLKNLHGWSDRVEQTHKGSVTLSIDPQDEEA